MIIPIFLRNRATQHTRECDDELVKSQAFLAMAQGSAEWEEWKIQQKKERYAVAVRIWKDSRREVIEINKKEIQEFEQKHGPLDGYEIRCLTMPLPEHPNPCDYL